MTALYLGIDPGKKGAVAIWGGGRIIDTMTLNRQTPSTVANVLGKHTENITFAVIEKVSSSPQMGVKSAFSFGESYGELLGILVALGIPFERHTPQRWQKHLGLSKKLQGRERKRALKTLAQERFPHIGVTLDNADAMLLAEYASNVKAPF